MLDQKNNLADIYKAIIENLPDGIVVIDRKGQFILINQQAERFLGIQGHELQSKFLHDFSGDFLWRQIIQLFDNRSRGPFFRKELFSDQTEQHIFQVSFVPVSADGAIFIYFHDISREKIVDRMKTEFVLIAAHQLRTPLANLKWLIRLFLDGDVGAITEEQNKLLGRGYESLEAMIVLINDLLNVGQLEEGRFLYKFSYTSIVDLIQKIMKGFFEEAARKNIKLSLQEPDGILPQVEIDEERMQLVLQNLLDNAIKYTPSGGEVTVSLKSDKMFIEIAVKDTGIGIPKNQQARIFDKFFRAANAAKLKPEGSGLGLFIGKNIIEKHGGKIWFESEEGGGTAFYFTVPFFHKLEKDVKEDLK